MNREIKFRGKRVDKGLWVFGYYRKVKDDSATILEPVYHQGHLVVCRDFPIILETVGQFLGLTDRDGKEIYEGDIVAVFNFKNLEFRHEVVFQKGAFGYKTEHYFISFVENNSFDWVNGKSDRILVVGNKWDNPELIGSEVAK